MTEVPGRRMPPKEPWRYDGQHVMVQHIGQALHGIGLYPGMTKTKGFDLPKSTSAGVMSAGTSSPKPQACDIRRLRLQRFQLLIVDPHILQIAKTGIDPIKRCIRGAQF